ncbi:MAG: hypothetical protein A2284_00895 [Deltaproteobacteria bacterium RIFOXYA12_FULL_61_11]|nr:MAG: hypothetical protein A2284_00895 [Deltaproteobacteria bacterium RIFOXYA12_FULL_61_11]
MTLEPTTCREPWDLGRITAEAARCLLCHDAPCSRDCPAGTDPGRFIRKVRLRNLKGAIRTIRTNNVFGGTCGLLCPTEKLCEKACSAAALDRPIRIGELQHGLVELGYRLGYNPLRPVPLRGPRVAILGSGPAGLACAAELARHGLRVTVFEREGEPGGVVRHLLPDQRVRSTIVEREIEDILGLGVEVRTGLAITGANAAKNLLDEGYAAVFVATGTTHSKSLGLAPAATPNLLLALPFLRACKGKPDPAVLGLVQGKTVTVIGGGDVAMDVAASALQLGASTVSVLYRRSFNEMPGDRGQKLATQELGVHFLFLVTPLAYELQQGSIVSVRLVRNELGSPDPDGRRRPSPLPGSEHLVPTDLVIEAIGEEVAPDNILLNDHLGANAGHLVRTDPAGRATNIDRVYAGGDTVRGPALVVQAVADGKAAAHGILERLQRS